LTVEIEDDAATLVGGDQEPAEAEADGQDDDDDEQARRQAIENIIKSSVQSGFSLVGKDSAPPLLRPSSRGRMAFLPSTALCLTQMPCDERPGVAALALRRRRTARN